MKNNVFTAKNTFRDGLVLDLAPDNTQPNCLTDALNATFLTYNGNELSLQNDMGNARIRSAFLPEGYIPLGSTEFGGIIYVVSYNPEINKCQIGSFPSPQRQYSTDNTGLTNSISWTDFQIDDKENNPTGEIKSMTKKVILSNLLSPGDKYALYYEGESKLLEGEKLSGFSVGDINEFPQLLKIHVVSFEEDGKIKYLDSSVKWYDDYFILNKNSNGNPIDNYKNLTQSGYSVFQSKVSGKLGLIFKLEAITGFSCTHDVVKLNEVTHYSDKNITNVAYAVNLNYSWTTDNEFVNPSCLILTKSEYDNNETDGTVIIKGPNNEELIIPAPPEIDTIISVNNKYKLGESTKENYLELKESYARNEVITDSGEHIEIKNIIESKTLDESNNIKSVYTYLENNQINLYEDTIVNKLKSSVYKNLGEIIIPYKNGDDIIKTDLVYNYEITPAMPYGKLNHLAQQGSIDFSKIGTGYTDLIEWRYYNTENLITLNLGFDIYPEEHHIVKQIGLSFYDNEGYKGTYLISGKKSYSGKFTEIIPLNNSIPSYKLINNYNGEYTITQFDSGTLVKLIADEDTIYSSLTQYKNSQSTFVKFEEFNNVENKSGDDIENKEGVPVKYEFTDAVISSNKLYLVKINIEYVNEFNQTNTNTYRTIYRWFWSNGIFNEHYYNTSDFSVLQPKLQFDCSAYYKANNLTLNQTVKDTVDNIQITEQSIKNCEIETSLQVGFQNNYDTFSLYHPKKENSEEYDTNESGALNKVEIKINIPEKSIIKYPETIEYKTFNDSNTDFVDLSPKASEIYEENNQSDQLKIEFKNDGTNTNNSYISSNEEYLENQSVVQKNCTLQDLYFISENNYKHDTLILDLENYHKNKLIYVNLTKQLPILKPIIYDKKDLDTYNLSYHRNSNEGHFYINNLYLIAGQRAYTHSASTHVFSLNQDGEIEINYSQTESLYTWAKSAFQYGYKNKNLLESNNDLMERTKDGFYLWAVDYNEQNNIEDTGQFSEIAVVPNNKPIINPRTNPIWFTNPDRLVTFPIDGDLRLDQRNYENGTSYDVLFKSSGDPIGNTTYPNGFSKSTMFGLALVYKGTWYTLNNIFNFNNEKSSNTLTQEIQYSGNQYQIPKDVNYYIDDLGVDFKFMNQQDKTPGYLQAKLTVENIENKYWTISGSKNKTSYINYKGNLFGIFENAEASINPNKLLAGDWTNFIQNDIFNLVSTNKLITKYNDNGIWKNSIPFVFAQLSTIEKWGSYINIDITIQDTNGELSEFKAKLSSTGFKYTDDSTNQEIEIRIENLYDSNATVLIFPKNIVFEREISELETKYTFKSNPNNTEYVLYAWAYQEDVISEQVTIPFSISENLNTEEDPVLKNNLPKTPGDALVGLLNSIYVKTKDDLRTIPIHSDTIYPNYTTQYIKDIFYEINIADDVEYKTILSIGDVPFNNYIKEFESYEKLPIDDNNISIVIEPCKKTIPINLNLNIPKVMIPTQENYNCYILRGGTATVATLDLTEGSLYYFDDNNRLKLLTQNTFSVPSEPELVQVDTQEYIHTLNSKGTFLVNNFTKSFEFIDNQLTLNEKTIVEDDLFQVTLDQIGTCASISDIPLKASLFKGTEILTTLNHVVE